MAEAVQKGPPSVYAMLGKAPCDGCGHATQCKAEQLACKAFEHYVETGEIPENPRWYEPQRAQYDAVFRPDTEDRRELAWQLKRQGLSQRAIARRLNVSHGSISNYLRGW